MGPCANLCCPRGLCVFIRCACAGVAGEHSIFHQDCHASTGNEDTLIGVGHTTTSKWPEPVALDFGRLCSASLGSTDHAGVKVPNRDLRWRKVPADEQARARAGLQLLPDNAVVCGECSGALRLSGQPLGDDAAREHLQDVLAANVAELPDAALSALAGWCTLRAWLRQDDGSISESSDGWRPVWLTPQCTRLNAVAGGRVLAKGRGGAMPSIVRGMVDFALNISSEAAAGTRAIFQALSAAVPSSFWAVSGEAFREQLSEVTNDRVRRIRARDPLPAAPPPLQPLSPPTSQLRQAANQRSRVRGGGLGCASDAEGLGRLNRENLCFCWTCSMSPPFFGFRQQYMYWYL